MSSFKPSWRFSTFAAGMGALTVLLLALAASPARAQRPDPVEDFKTLLKASVDPTSTPQLEDREKKLLDAAKNLQSANDLRQVLVLTEWKDDPKYSIELSLVDQKVRAAVGMKLDAIIHDAVDKGDITQQFAAASLIGDMGATIRALNFADTNGFCRSLAPHLVKLISKPGTDPVVRQVAARSLGKINPEPKAAVAALKDLLLDPKSSVKDRQAASEALADMAREVLKLQKQARSRSDVNPTRADVMAAASEVVPVASLCLKDSDSLVRRNGLDAIVQATNDLNELVLDPFKAEDLPPADAKWTDDDRRKVREKREMLDAEAKDFIPLVTVLKDQGHNLADKLGDPVLEARVLARRALELIGSARLRWIRRQESLPFEPGSKPDQLPGDPLRQTLEPGVLKIKNFAADPDARVRQATIEFLEAIEDAAIPAHGTLVAALKDKDRFIRWAAVRTLGKIGVVKDDPAKTNNAVLGIAALLNPKEDSDVREVAAVSLRRFGSAAKLAVPQLIKMLNVGEAEAQEAVIKAIIAAAPDNKDAVKPLIKSLDARSPAVRRLAADALGALGPLASEAIPALREHSDDEDNSVRQAIGGALLSISKKR